MFFTVGTFDPRRELGLHRAQWFANAGADVVLREYRLSHDLRVRAERARFLEDSARYFSEKFATRCQ
jgi:hypothetical protein